MEQTAVRSMIKRVNLLLVLIAFVLSGGFGVHMMRAGYKVDLEEALKPKFDETQPYEVVSSDFDPKDIIQTPEQQTIEKDKRKERLSAISTTKHFMIGVGYGLSTFTGFLLIIMTFSWVIGFKFKLHISTK